MKDDTAMRQRLELFINGIPIHVSAEHVTWTLSEFLRDHMGLVGTKIVCAEGDCGACSVLVGRPDPDERSLSYRSIDSCIVFMHQLDLTHVVTVEGLQNADETLSAVQQAMVDCHGSQCGFCTPGFVMATHGVLEEQKESASINRSDWALGLSGNLCRCTGYVQIMDACLSVPPDRVKRINSLYPPYEILRSLSQWQDTAVEIIADPIHVFVPRTVDQAFQFKSDHPDTRVVSGATDIGVQRNHGNDVGAVQLVLAGVPELTRTERNQDELVFGAAVTWSGAMDSLSECFPEFSEIVLRFGSPQIRNVGTLGGNLANASPIADSIPFLIAVDAKIDLSSVRGTRTVPIDQFYLGYKDIDLQPDELITAIRCPILKPNQHLNLHKVSRRRDMDISTFTAGILISIDAGTVSHARIALGGVGPTVLRVKMAEEFLVGKPWNEATMRAAGVVARDEISPIKDVRGSDQYRRQLAENIFVKCFHDLDASSGEQVS